MRVVHALIRQELLKFVESWPIHLQRLRVSGYLLLPLELPELMVMLHTHASILP